VWDPATGACEGALTGHDSSVYALLVVGPRLVSGDVIGMVKVWRRSGEGAGGGVAAEMVGWECERTVRMEGGAVYALAAWGERSVCCGMRDGRIRVWGLVDGAREAELQGHTGVVSALLVHGDRLYSTGLDGTIRAWACGTWAGLRTVEATGGHAGGGGGPGQFSCSLVASGGRRVSGSRRDEDGDSDEAAGGRGVCEVRVWELETLGLQHVVAAGRVRCGEGVRCLARVGREVWGGVGEEAVVWGRD
jgi:WD40 repeat protein